MGLSFFRALNPASKNSGITYYLPDPSKDLQGREMIDLTVSENISDAWSSKLNFLSATFNIIMGDHYDLQGGKKGVLDYLIFPLIARKLWADIVLLWPEEEEASRGYILVATLVLQVVCYLELVRFIAAIALTLLLAPIVAVKHMMPNDAMQAEGESAASNDAFCPG